MIRGYLSEVAKTSRAADLPGERWCSNWWRRSGAQMEMQTMKIYKCVHIYIYIIYHRYTHLYLYPVHDYTFSIITYIQICTIKSAHVIHVWGTFYIYRNDMKGCIFHGSVVLLDCRRETTTAVSWGVGLALPNRLLGNLCCTWHWWCFTVNNRAACQSVV